MDNGKSPVRARLEAWRAAGSDRLDPLRFALIDAMERRASGYDGEPRKRLEHRLSELVASYAGDLERTAAETHRNAGHGHGHEAACAETDYEAKGGRHTRARGPLGQLADELSSRRAADGHGNLERAARAGRAMEPPADVVDYFREVWSKVSTERQLRQSFEQVPGNAGPLNSSSLVYRALTLMRELSPDYLQRFMAYVDTLSWMEHMGGGLAMPGKDTPRAVGGRKHAKGRSR